MRTTLIGVVLALVAAGAARADDDAGWEKLGEKEVAFRGDRDVIPVGAQDGRFDALRLHVTGNGLELLDLKVVFGNGESQDVTVRENLAEGARTRVIDLTGNTRVITRVELVYKTEGRRREGRATVHVWGRRTGGGGAARERWDVLGEKEVLFRAERDVIEVGAREGRYSRLMLEAVGNGVELLDVDVIFGDGDHQDVAVREVLRAGTRTRVIDLRGGPRVIKRVALVYRTDDQKNREGRATIRVHGLFAEGGAAAAPAGGGRDEGVGAGWTLLGEKEVLFQTERDAIAVGSRDGRFRQLKLLVRGNGIEFLDLKVTFGNGDVQDVAVRQVIEAGGATREIDLPGEARVIRSVELVYRTRDQKNRDGRAHVRVFGK